MKRWMMTDKILSEIRNKLTAPKIVLEKLAKGEKVPREFLEPFDSLRSLRVSPQESGGGAQLAAAELNAAAELLGGKAASHQVTKHHVTRKYLLSFLV